MDYLMNTVLITSAPKLEHYDGLIALKFGGKNHKRKYRGSCFGREGKKVFQF
jgi:hypothetical protein